MKEALCIFCASKKGVKPEYEPLTSSVSMRDYTCPVCKLSFMQIKGEIVGSKTLKDLLDKIKSAREISKSDKDYPGKERRYKIFLPDVAKS